MAVPASIFVRASFNLQFAREGGTAIVRKARMQGFNVQFAGGSIDQARDAAMFGLMVVDATSIGKW